MPILPPQRDIYPDELLDRQEMGSEQEMVWWLLMTMSRQEKQLMKFLLEKGISFYGPLVLKHGRTPSGRSTTSQIPLFPSYVFLYGTGADRYRARTTGCVVNNIEVKDGVRLTAELRQIHRLLTSGKPVTPEQKLESGDHVRIRSGPLAGIEGAIVRREGKDRLLIVVDFLRQGASIVVDDFEVEKVVRTIVWSAS